MVRASEDPQAELRWNALESLASLPPRSSEGRACVEEALAGDDPARRAVVAMARGDDPELAVLRGVLLEPSTPTAMRERVVDWISTRWWQGGVAAAAEPALVVALLTMPRGAARADGLALVLNGPSRGNPDWESALVPVLGDERVEVVVDACQALGACGGRPAVRALSLRTRRGEPRAVRRAAKRATLAIRARLGPANAGHLSVASAAPGGELTLETAGGEGGLSL